MMVVSIHFRISCACVSDHFRLWGKVSNEACLVIERGKEGVTNFPQAENVFRYSRFCKRRRNFLLLERDLPQGETKVSAIGERFSSSGDYAFCKGRHYNIIMLCIHHNTIGNILWHMRCHTAIKEFSLNSMTSYWPDLKH